MREVTILHSHKEEEVNTDDHKFCQSLSQKHAD